MPFSRFAQPPFRVRQLIFPLALTAILALAACSSGSSDKATATSASVAQSSAPATSAATSAPNTPAAAATSAPATSAAATTSAPTTSAAATATATSDNSATPEATTAASSDGTGLSDLISKDVADAWDNVTSYKLTLNIYEPDATSPSLTSTTETMKPDKEHTVSNFAGATIESIRIGSDTYIKFGDTWQKAPGLDQDAAPPVSGDDVVKDFTDPSTPNLNVVKKDDETLDGVKTTVYEVTADDGSVITMWIGKDDHLPRKSVVNTDSNRIEVIYSDYGKDFDIKAPI